MAEKDDEEESTEVHEEVIHSCDKCDFESSDVRDMEKHKAGHVVKLKCPVDCPQTFDTLELLEVHFLNKHVDDNKSEAYKCSICKAKFKSEFYLRKHTEYNHRVENIECNICGEIFDTKQALNTHNLAHRSINSPSSTNNEGFSCQSCTYKFRTQVNLKKHVEKHHKNNRSNQRNFDCNKCGRVFDTKMDAEKHTKDCEDHFIENRRDCRYFKRGNCRKGDHCKFRHEKKPECRNGLSCRYFAQGRCKFNHSSEAIAQTNVGSVGDFRYCLFGAQCRNLPQCPLIHYNVDFPYLPSSRNPPTMAKRNARSPANRR